jgi:ABC-type nitrate/sulfonate/bicarbonate transport system ATPase subunit
VTGSPTETVAPGPVPDATPPSGALELRSVGATYGSIPVLRDIDLSVAPSEIVCLVGPSGCGKTTLLHVIGGLMEPSEGAVTMDGAPVVGPGPDRVTVFQEDAVFPWLKARANVEYGLRVKGLPKSERRVIADEALSLVGLSGAAEKYPRELSGGMRKRVDLARALAVRPRVLLMDEPYAALDAMTKERLQVAFLSACAAYGTTSVFVTHDLEEAIFVGDRVVCMGTDPGCVQAVHTVPFGRDRDVTLKLEPEFQQTRGALMEEISRATGGTSA